MNESKQELEPRILHSWKEIAAHVGMGLRTVQRYERLFGMPVRRHAGSRSAVFAFAGELDAWMKSARLMAKSPAADGQRCQFCFGTGLRTNDAVVQAIGDASMPDKGDATPDTDIASKSNETTHAA